MPNDQQTGQNQASPATSQTGDLQIKSTGAAGLQTAAVATASGQGTVVGDAPQPSAVPATINLAEAAPSMPPASPVNKRAFNLAEGTETASASTAAPEKFAIPKMVLDQHGELVELIKATESMDDQERQYWFQILPIMTPEQIEKFRNILQTEKNQLAELDKEYEQELNRLNDKHLLEWKEFESKEKSRTIKEAEAKSAADEKKQEEDLLAKLSDV